MSAGGKDTNLGRVWSRVPPMGYLTLAAFVICGVSGVMLALVFRVDAPADSIGLLALKNPAGLLVRSAHYWSAQFFLVLTILHIADHLIKGTENRVTHGVWLRLTLTLPVIVYAMLSGFILKGDPDGEQAALIFRNLLEFLPWIGRTLASIFVGDGTHLFNPYLHHVCTATIIIWLTTIEHARRIVPDARSSWWMLVPVLLFSILLVPELRVTATEVEKGPWYLIGLQEMLHWLPDARAAVWLLVASLVGFAFLAIAPVPARRFMKRSMLAGLGAYAILSVIGIAFRSAGWSWDFQFRNLTGGAAFQSFRAYQPPHDNLIATEVPHVNGHLEGCLACHQGMTGFAPAHDPDAIGCSSCHGGRPFSLVASVAHAGMTLTPGNLSVVSKTCATAKCHSDIEPRIRASLMNTMSGVVAVDRFVFGENADLDQRGDIHHIGFSSADTHLRQLCASCHLGQEKAAPEPISEQTRGGGCAACHLNYSDEASTELARLRAAKESDFTPRFHPTISLNIPNKACFGCHSRSGRISTNYEGWHETQLDVTAARRSADWPGGFRVLEDGRVFEKRTPDVHHEKGMSCVDCHVAAEVMGDGARHAHQENAIKTACLDCHNDRPPRTAALGNLDPETQKIVALRHLDEPRRQFLLTASGEVAYPNAFLGDDGRVNLVTKDTGTVLEAKPLLPVCGRETEGHQRMECRTCHSAWAPQCISCHTSFNPNVEGWDHLANRDTRGTWEEVAANLRADPPVLGVERVTAEDGSAHDRIATFAPGMIMTLAPTMRNAPKENEFHRLYAPVAPHTIVTKARGCRSCHNDPLALGYGRGTLTYDTTDAPGVWRFAPEFPASEEDGLPMDAWIGFLDEPPAGLSTRTNTRPLSLDQQRRVLLVGACLNCHQETRSEVARVFADFRDFRRYLSPRCVLPDWIGDVSPAPARNSLEQP